MFFALMGIGFALILETVGIYNFATSAFYILGGYLTYTFYLLIYPNPAIAILFAAISIYALGLLIGATILKYIKERSRSEEEWILAGLIALLSLNIFFENLALVIFGPDYKGISYYVIGDLKISDLSINIQKLISAFSAFMIIIVIHLFLKFTRIGIATRAVAQDITIAQLSGIRSDLLQSLAFGLGCTLAAVAGSLLLPYILCCSYRRTISGINGICSDHNSGFRLY